MSVGPHADLYVKLFTAPVWGCPFFLLANAKDIAQWLCYFSCRCCLTLLQVPSLAHSVLNFPVPILNIRILNK